MTKKDIYDAYVTIRKSNCTIPDDVLDFMEKSAIEKLERTFKPTTVEEMENTFDIKRFAYDFSGWCWGKEIPHEVGALEKFVLRFFEEKKQSSAHSFTEGMDTAPYEDKIDAIIEKPFKPHEPTIDEMITAVQMMMRQLTLGYALTRNDDVCLRAALKTLDKVRSFAINQSLGIDLEQVIGDLVEDLKRCNRSDLAGYHITMDRAESALSMIRSFKRKAPPEWVKRFAQVKTVTQGETQWSQYPKEMQQVQALTKEIIYQRVARMLHNTNEYGEAKAIIYAIEQMAKLNPIGTV